MNRENKIIVLIVCLLSIYLIKTMLTPYNVELVDERDLYDFKHYQEISKWYLGINNSETGRNYQYPPLYPVLVSPSLFLNERLFLIIFDNVFITLTFIPLVLLLHKWLSFNNSILISFFLVLFNIAFSPKSSGFPIVLSSFLFTCFIYFFYDINKKLKHTALFFSLLIITKYLFFFLSPMILVWMYLRKEKLNRIIMFFIPSSLLFALWSFRNGLIHGFTMHGMFGGYKSTFALETPLNIPVGLVPAKVSSIFTDFLSNTILNYFSLFILGAVLIIYFYHKKNKIFMEVFNLKTYYFYIILLFNLLLFVFTLGMTYNHEVFHWRYLTYLIPVYVSLGIMPFIKLIELKQSRHKKQKQ